MGADGFAGDAGCAQFVAQGGDELKFHRGFLSGVVKKAACGLRGSGRKMGEILFGDVQLLWNAEKAACTFNSIGKLGRAMGLFFAIVAFRDVENGNA